jgi:hypothetical protein
VIFFIFFYIFKTFHQCFYAAHVNMKINPYGTVSGTVTMIHANDRAFTITPCQYIMLTPSASPFLMHAQLADITSNSCKSVGPTITFDGTLQCIVREHSIDKLLWLVRVELAYLPLSLHHMPFRIPSNKRCSVGLVDQPHPLTLLYSNKDKHP